MSYIRKISNRKSSAVYRLLLAVVCSTLYASDLSSDYTWKPVRIGAGGWMRGMVVHPLDPNVRYARGDVDNVYRWSSAQNEWLPMKVASALPANVVAAPTSAGGSAIAVDPQNTKVVYMAYAFYRSADLSSTNPTVNLNVYKSTDGGQTFTAGNLSLSGDTVNETGGERLAVDPKNGNIVYFGSPNNGLWRSTDGGSTWSNVTANGAPSSTAHAQFPRFDGGSGQASLSGQNVSRYVYVTVSGGAVLQSKDGGNTWASISAGQPFSGKTIFATVDQSGTFWTTDGSANLYAYSRAGSWRTLTTPRSVNGIAIDPRTAVNAPDRIFAMAQGGGLSRSNDGGQTWTDLGGALTFSETQTIQWLRPSAIRPQNHYLSNGGIYMDANGNLWSPTGNDGVITTTPNDSTDSSSNPPVWSSSSIGIEEMVAQHAVIPPGQRPILTVEDETLFTISNPDTFTAQHYTVNLWNNNNGLSSAMDINYVPNQPKYVAVTSDNVFAGSPLTNQYSGYSADGGQSWSLFPSIVNKTNPCILYSGTIAISARASGHENDGPGSDNIVRIPSNIYSQNSPAPFYSKDGGATWHQSQSFNSAPGAFTYQGCNSSPINDKTAYTYMGNQWGAWNPSLKQHLLVADPVKPGKFYADLAAGGFWTSSDGGVTWTQISNNGLPLLAHHGDMEAVPGVSGDLWFVDGHEGSTGPHGLYHSTNGGTSFTRSAAFDYAWELALGKPASGASYPSIYVYGRLAGDPQWGVFQSIDEGNTFNRIGYYPYGLVDVPTVLAASWDIFGTVYIGFSGNSYYYATYNSSGGSGGGTGPVSGATYTLANQASGLVLDDAGFATAPGSAVVQWPLKNDGSTNQNWTLHDAGNGWFTIVNQYSGLCLDDQHSSTAVGATVWQYTCNGTAAQNWHFTPASNGYYTFTNQASGGLVLDNKGAATAPGSVVWLYTPNGTAAQNWLLQPVTH